ncbi:glycoside hydrolase family 2 TIM barrel-domain containing protein [Capnocytophaga catalasegens]|uniref:Beta-galactosidase n=1 Tax=Capnocytophaga catalasegens TaxID=1004260 RepID=A0AAV5ASG4_9FLAO|nr:glycoside hydrolase family 2 TIM barrel-domain containing protein [Capnocytophaga catalasegens]GIZ14848.1 beta-galactosidase [Capnocytophaga catalasegens]GJM49185.1 beta-galactosidase [Capnocytophaga catalasegens]GJM52603.1 beta-galactosidase [Capnocytophaga catalasegens]
MKNIFLSTILFGLGSIGIAQTSQSLEKGWKFTREDQKNFSQVNVNDKKWQNVVVPHDWAIYGPFDIENDVQRTAIKQDGQVAPIEHSGRTGGLPFVGVGWYRNSFDVPNFSADKKVFLQFDGAMSNPEVFVNGQKAGEWHNGYNTFFLDITPFVKAKNNTLAVRLENMTQQSRWYPGAGLYRNVHLIVKNKTHIPIWGIQITTPEITPNFAKINIKTDFISENPPKIEVVTDIYNPKGEKIASERKKYDDFITNNIFSQEIYVKNPQLWDIQQPNLYKAISKIYENGELKDETSTTFGIRKIEIKPNDGFYLNNRKIKFQGACMHHDLGAIGAAVNEAAIRRQIRIMQDMGVNAIRTSHNMPSPEYVRIADEMGMMLAVESFDEWAIAKVENGYNRYFKDWAEKDLTNLVKHYRNNPSVVMWFIGNEVEEQSVEEGAKVARYLQDIIKKHDTTRPVSNGMDRPDHVFNNNMAATMEVAGFNYRPFRYQDAYKKLPQQIILGSETASTISSRGVYKFPVERKSMPKYDDQQTSSYDLEHCGWSNLPEDDWIQHEDLPYTIGEFIWTGFDYLGEPTPYYVEWPAHSSYFGAVDLAGIPKDRFYLYRSHWKKEEPTLHVLPHWNWEGREDEITPIFVYTNYPTAEVFINGKSQGKRSKDLTIPLDGSYTTEAQKSLERQKRYRLMWLDTKYEAGEVKVVAYDANGKAVAEKIVKTAGKPHALRLSADRTTIKADGKDLSFITVEAIDKDGNLCPLANNLITFKVSGMGTYRASANGDATSTDQFHLPKMHLFNGKLVAIVQSGEKAGKITFSAQSKGLQGKEIELITE